MSEGTDVNSGDYDHRTPLHLAASEGLLPVVVFLLEDAGSLTLPLPLPLPLTPTLSLTLSLSLSLSPTLTLTLTLTPNPNPSPSPTPTQAPSTARSTDGGGRRWTT